MPPAVATRELPQMSSIAQVTIHASQFPEAVRRDLLASLRTRQVNQKFHYDSVKQTQRWLALHQQYGLRYLCAVPSTLYGPGYHTDGRQMHFIFDLIRKIIRGKELGERVVLWGDGQQSREVMFLPDFVRLLGALAASRDNDLVNIGAGEEHTIRRFAELICEIVGYPAERIEYDTSRYVGARTKCLNVARLRSIIPSYELTSLEHGLRETIRWFYDVKAYR